MTSNNYTDYFIFNFDELYLSVRGLKINLNRKRNIEHEFCARQNESNLLKGWEILTDENFI